MKKIATWLGGALCLLLLTSCGDDFEDQIALVELRSEAIQQVNVDIRLPEDEISKYPTLEEEVIEFALHQEEDFDRILRNGYNAGKDVGEWTLVIDIEVRRNDDLYMTLVGQTFMYTKGINGSVTYYTWNYHKPSQSIVSLGDILLDSQVSLEKISVIARDDVMGRNISNENWIRNGTEPKLDRYETWYALDDGSIHFIFDPYELAGYAEGPIDVTVPFEKARESIKLEYLQPSPGSEN